MKMKKGFTLVEIMIVVAIIGLLATMGLPSLRKARETSRKNACVNNLRVIDSAKEQEAIELNLADGGNSTDITLYIKGGALPTCPAGGAYTAGAVGTDPTCSYSQNGVTHVLP